MNAMLDDLKRFFVEKVFDFETSPLLFNQYKKNDPRFDIPGGSSVRRENLFAYIDSFCESRPSYIVCGEAPGIHGCRFSGVPFTDEEKITSGTFFLQGKKTSDQAKKEREISASVFWDALDPFRTSFFVYNCVPFLPMRKDDPLSMRTPTESERKECKPLLDQLVSIIKPTMVIGIGSVACKSMEEIGIDCKYVRHPARGGATKFRKGIDAIFGARKKDKMTVL